MTVGELIRELQRYDETRLVCINTMGMRSGLFPIADTTQPYTVAIGEGYDTVILQPSSWPTGGSE